MDKLTIDTYNLEAEQVAQLHSGNVSYFVKNADSLKEAVTKFNSLVDQL